MHHQALNSLWLIVRLNSKALERAVVAGVIPSLMLIVRVSLYQQINSLSQRINMFDRVNNDTVLIWNNSFILVII